MKTTYCLALLCLLTLLSSCQQELAAPDGSSQKSKTGDPASIDPQPSDPQLLVGRWQGQLDSEGQSIGFSVAFRRADTGLRGRFELPGRDPAPIESVVVHPARIQFDFDSPAGPASFSGSLDRDSVGLGAISGTFEMGPNAGTFTLEAIAAPDVDRIFADFMDEHHVPGIAAAMVRDGEITWVGSYGMANVSQAKPVTPQTIFHLASVSKTITSAALMQLHAQGEFELDDDINQYLPFRVFNPAFPNQSITFGQLLRHRSSIRDDPEFYGPLWSEPQGDPEIELGEYLESYLSVDGAQYSAENNFFGQQPDSEFHYCNTCYALLGYLAERISGQPFESYSKRALFEPLGMVEAAWTFAEVDAEQTALPYRYDAESDFEPYGVVGYPDWPAGLLRTNVTELATFLAAYTQLGVFEGRQIFDPSVVSTLTPGNMALGSYNWFVSSLESTSDVLYSHGGGDLGARTMIAFNPATRDGFVLLSNGESDLSLLASELYRVMPALGWD